MSNASDIQSRWGTTDRRDLWWIDPLLTLLVLSVFVIYATLRAVMNRDYEIGELISPFYSPNLGHWTVLPQWLSPAMLILWAPGGFRLTCYYYRKAYYRSFTLHPPGCAVAEGMRGDYRGETAFPLILQNLHRYLFYATFLYLPFLWSDVVHATRFGGSFGIGLGTLVILANTTALTFYSFSCHSARHLVGGGLDCFSRTAASRACHAAWKGASVLNARHMLFAWMSFFTVCSADLYVRLLASGVIHDVRLL